MKRLLVILLPLFLLVSCSPISHTESEQVSLYYFEADNSDKLVSIDKKLSMPVSEDVVAEIFHHLKDPEDTKNFLSAITGDINLQDVSISEKTCTLTLSKRYNKISDVSRAAINACITKTLCSLSDFDNVVILCEDLSYAFNKADFLTDTPQTHYDIYTVNLYYANATLDDLEAYSEVFSITPDTALELSVASRLLTAPSSESLRVAFPEGTRINNVYVDEGICFVDLSPEFVNNIEHSRIREGIALYSIINTMTGLPMIDSVKFLIDGNPATGYSFYDLSSPFTNSSELFTN